MNRVEIVNHKSVKSQNHVKNVMLNEKGFVVRMNNGPENHLELRKEGPVMLVVRMKNGFQLNEGPITQFHHHKEYLDNLMYLDDFVKKG